MDWLFTIDNVKMHLNTQRTDKEVCIVLSKKITKKLKYIKTKLDKLPNFKADDKEGIIEEIEGLMEKTEFTHQLATEVAETDWIDFGFSGNWQEEVNDMLDELYTLGNTKLYDNRGNKHGLVWVS